MERATRANTARHESPAAVAPPAAADPADAGKVDGGGRRDVIGWQCERGGGGEGGAKGGGEDNDKWGDEDWGDEKNVRKQMGEKKEP